MAERSRPMCATPLAGLFDGGWADPLQDNNAPEADRLTLMPSCFLLSAAYGRHASNGPSLHKL